MWVRFITLPFLGHVSFPHAGTWLTVIGLVAMMNVVNFSDGVDGLAAGLCAIVGLAFTIIAFDLGNAAAGVLSAITAGAALGFLVHNFPRADRPARTFMGDCGSNLLGLLMGVVCVDAAVKTEVVVSFVLPLILLAVPFLDTTFVVLKRLKYQQPVYRADSEHFHHRLARIGFSRRKTLVYMYTWTLMLAGLALALRFVPYSDHHGHYDARLVARDARDRAARGRRERVPRVRARDPQVPPPRRNPPAPPAPRREPRRDRARRDERFRDGRVRRRRRAGRRRGAQRRRRRAPRRRPARPPGRRSAADAASAGRGCGRDFRRAHASVRNRDDPVLRRRSLAALFALVLALAVPASAGALVVGIAEQTPDVFNDSRFVALGIDGARLSVAWDVFDSRAQTRTLDRWLRAARADGVSPLISFDHHYPSERGHSPPSPGALAHEFRIFRARYPWVHDFATWNEANHCGEPTCHRPALVASYYRALRQTCRSCTVLGAELLDEPGMLAWVRAFDRALGGQPAIWGLHNYLGANRLQVASTLALLRATSSEIWFTETGGLVARHNHCKRGLPGEPGPRRAGDRLHLQPTRAPQPADHARLPVSVERRARRDAELGLRTARTRAGVRRAPGVLGLRAHRRRPAAFGADRGDGGGPAPETGERSSPAGCSGPAGSRPRRRVRSPAPSSCATPAAGAWCRPRRSGPGSASRSRSPRATTRWRPLRSLAAPTGPDLADPARCTRRRDRAVPDGARDGEARARRDREHRLRPAS